LQYEGVPFGPTDFHGHESCPTANLEISNYEDPIQSRNCRLGGLRDLNQGKDYVREKQAAFLNHLIDIGVAGFRSDASKHMWPADLENIYSRLHNLNTKFFPANSRPFVYHEVIYYGGNGIKSSEYTKIGRGVEFHYYRDMGNVFHKRNQQLKYLKNFGESWGMLPSGDALVMLDNHDLQRGHTGSFDTNINFFDSTLLKMSTAFMLAWPYGVTRVMSSYNWPRKIEVLFYKIHN
jgi:alpha-amylase